MQPTEIVLPETSPETEWVRGRPLVKVSPKRRHARVQLLLGHELLVWAGDRGEVGTEWRFRVRPPREARRPLVPDIAYVSRELLRGRTAEELEAPDFAPTVAVEVLSRRDAALDVADKVDVYLRSGCELVIVADPMRRTVMLHDRDGTTALDGSDELRHGVLPGFALRLDVFFASALDVR